MNCGSEKKRLPGSNSPAKLDIPTGSQTFCYCAEEANAIKNLLLFKKNTSTPCFVGEVVRYSYHRKVFGRAII
jgi:hypothetical protein